MKTIILAAGYATRLYPLTKDKPKALLPVGSKPLLTHLLENIRRIPGDNEVVLVTNDRFASLFDKWSKDVALGGSDGSDIRVLNDGTTSNENRLGAIGNLQFAIQNCGIQEDVLVLASDNLFDGELKDFVSFARSKKAEACIGTYDIKDPSIAAGRYGIIEIDDSFRITGIEEKPEKPKTSFVSMGVYYFSKTTLSGISEYLKHTSKKDAPGYYATWLLSRIPVHSYIFTGRWFDIGSVEQLGEASRAYESK